MLSIVITTYNRAQPLQRLLKHLENQTSSNFEVVVAMDGSTDETQNILLSARTSYALNWVNTNYTGYGLSIARNMGILAASGDTVVILDDDSFPEPDFVAAHLSAQCPGVMTCGPRYPADPESNTQLAVKMERLKQVVPLNPEPISTLLAVYPGLSLVENNLSMSREDWISLGLFTERLKLYGVVGQEFFARARHLGAKWQFAPAAAIMHDSGLEGDNGLDRGRKTRQTRLAQVLRPALMTPRQYQVQIDWAETRAQGRDIPVPNYPASGWVMAPAYFGRRLLSDAKRKWKCK
tara:strand:- start:3752 stop:4630 length:879 start_codon:yes stop_codon:yes gene_type:complete